MKRNLTRIRITRTSHSEGFTATFCEKVLKLRTARKVGDVEVVNQTVIGLLQRNLEHVNFEVIPTE